MGNQTNTTRATDRLEGDDQYDFFSSTSGPRRANRHDTDAHQQDEQENAAQDSTQDKEESEAPDFTSTPAHYRCSLTQDFFPHAEEEARATRQGFASGKTSHGKTPTHAEEVSAGTYVDPRIVRYVRERVSRRQKS